MPTSLSPAVAQNGQIFGKAARSFGLRSLGGIDGERVTSAGELHLAALDPDYARSMNSRLNVVSISIEYPNPREPSKGLFIRARLQALAKAVNLKVFSPVALLDYANPEGRLLGSRGIPAHRTDQGVDVFHPSWIYPPRGGFLNAFFLFFRMLRPLRRLSRMAGVDVLDAHFLHPDGVATALAAGFLNKPFMVTVRGCELRHRQFRMRRFWMRWAIRRAARVIAVSDNLKEFALEMGAEPTRVKLIPNGIDNNLFFPRNRIQCRAKHGIAPERLVVLSVGDLAEIKGHHRVIAAIGALRDGGVRADLLIAGGPGRSGRYAELLRHEVAARRLEHQVRFLGSLLQTEVAELMSAATVFCLASSREGCPNVVMESLACGTPVVATDVGAVRRLVPSDEFGYVVPPGKPQALQSALGEALHRQWDRASIAEWCGRRTWREVADEVATEVHAVAAEASRDPKAIIVNADDLGISREVNAAIFELMARHRISSATIMANGPAFEHAVREVRSLGGRSFGVHLNLTEFRPLSETSWATSLVNSDGLLSRDIVKATIRPALLRAMYEELCAQVNRVVNAGMSISHFDSHHHIHTVPFVFPVVKAVQRRYGIYKIRISKNIYSEQVPCSPALRVKKSLYNWALQAGSETTEGFTDLSSFCEAARNRGIRQRTIELMVHPGARAAEQETALLSSAWEETMPFAVRHLNYNQLCMKATAARW